MNTCQSCRWYPEKRWKEEQCCRGISIEGCCPTYSFYCRCYEKASPKLIVFEATVSGLFRGRIEDGTPMLELSGMSPQDIMGFPLGAKLKVTLEPQPEKE